jgi:branched-chain amino acid transport system permease protein
MLYFVNLMIIGLSIGMVYGLIAVGISFIYAGLDMVHFAHGEIYMFGAFWGLIGANLGLPFPLILVFSMIMTAVMGMLIERVLYRRLTMGGGGLTVAGMGIIICGFGMSIVLQNLAFLIWGPAALRMPVDLGPSIVLGTLSLPRSYLWILVATVVLMTSLHVFLKYTRLGLAVRAVSHSKSSASLMGVNVPLTISLIFGASCALAAAAGVLASPVSYVQVQMGTSILIKSFAAAVVGGLGSLPGAVIGGLIVGVVESLGAGYLAGEYKDVYAFLVLIAVLMIRPSGLFGVHRLREKA